MSDDDQKPYEKFNLNDQLDVFSKNLLELANSLQDKSYFSSVIDSDKNRTILIDGKWGSGKSFFIQYFIEQHLQAANQEENTPRETKQALEGVSGADKVKLAQFNYVVFDAFKNDFFEDAFLPVTGEILKKIGCNNGGPFKKAAIGVMSALVSLGSDFLAHKTGMDPSKAYDKAKSEMNNHKVDYFSEYDALSKQQETFKKELEQLCKETPLIIFIDEMDRCRPSFAIELLERVKHFFNVNNVIFIVLADCNALTSIIKKHYGYEFDAKFYLSKFFEFELALPVPASFFEKDPTTGSTPSGEAHLTVLSQFCNLYSVPPREHFRIRRYLESKLFKQYTQHDQIVMTLLLCIKLSKTELYGQILDFYSKSEWFNVDLSSMEDDGNYGYWVLSSFFEMFYIIPEANLDKHSSEWKVQSFIKNMVAQEKIELLNALGWLFIFISSSLSKKNYKQTTGKMFFSYVRQSVQYSDSPFGGHWQSYEIETHLKRIRYLI